MEAAMAGTEASRSTLRSQAAELDEKSHPVALWLRRAALTVMALVVLADLTGRLGVHTGKATAQENGYSLTLRYPAVARSGLDVKWQVQVSHPGGFGKELTLAVTGDYFDIFETQGFHPNPSDETRTGNTLYLTFTAPPGDTFVVDFDAYIQPASQAGRSATVALVTNATFQPVVSVPYRTRLFP
jgi:hypothetical protein